MQRAACRFIRGSCRKFLDNDKPVVAGEEVRKKQEQRQNVGAPPKHTLGEAVGWTAGLLLIHELNQKRRSYFPGVGISCFQPCPFKLTKQAVTQPQLKTLNVVSKHAEVIPKPAPLRRKDSIDRRPFLPEITVKETDLYFQAPIYDDDSIVFSSEETSVEDIRDNEQFTQKRAKEVKRFVGDMLSSLGVAQILQHNRSVVLGDPPLGAKDLLKRGAEYGSSRALYNIGVMYDKEKETELAEEYFKRAADLGHPLASYNYAVFEIRRGHAEEGRRLMEYAAQHGVVEAKDILKEFASLTKMSKNKEEACTYT